MNKNNPHINVFIAYARKDVDYLNELRVYLKPLDRNRTIKIWYDGEIIPGTPWEKEIKDQLKKADIILLLVSANALASDYFYETEMEEALKRHEEEETTVIPVILRSCTWNLTPLRDLQALPRDAKPITQWADDADAYTDVVNGINRSIGTIRDKEGARQQKIKAEKEAQLKAEEARIEEEKESKRKAEAARKEAEKLAALAQPIQDLIKDMILIEGGTFQMGSESGIDNEKPIHPVSLSAFQLGKYQVTQAQWQAVMGINPSHFKGGNRPVETVSWNDTQDFIKKLNEMTGKDFRLPTEAEWEFAARGGSKSQGYEYAGSDDINKVAWYRENSGGKTHPVGEKEANELGLYDMSGNVWEWCNDYYDKDYYKISPENNPKGSESAAYRVLRGGSWGDDSGVCRSAYRLRYQPVSRLSGYVGFRLAETP